jgi:hypothetical protein
MTDKEALKLALEALDHLITGFRIHDLPYGSKAYTKGTNAIREIQAALAQPSVSVEQEPVAWRAWVSKFPQGTGSDWVYVTNPIMEDKIHNQPLYTTPPQRPSRSDIKPLTDEDMEQIAKKFSGSFASLVRCLREVEAAHGIYAPTERKGEV